jgi:hypothetical protein
LNQDRAVNIVDVQLMVDQILSGQPPPASDITGDGQVNVVDLQRIVLAVLGYGCIIG